MAHFFNGRLRRDVLQSEAGLSLVEIIVATVIIATIGVLVQGILVSNRQFSSTSDSRTQALNYAQETLEGLKNAVSIVSANSNPLDVSSSFMNGGLDGLPAGATREYVVETLPSGLKKVTVTVTWTDV